MNSLRRLTTYGTLAILVVTLPAVAVVYYYFGAVNAAAFVYGVAVGVVVFTAIALAVSLITGPTTSGRMLFGILVYVGRLGFAALAVGLPVALVGWPILPIFCGFVVVYVVENVAMLVVLGTTKSSASSWRSGEAKRRIEV